MWTFEELCVGPGYENRPYLNLVFCSGNTTGTSIPHQPLSLIFLRTGQLKDQTSGMCVGLANGVLEAGALLQLQPCLNRSKATPSIPDLQRFFYESVTGEITSYVPSHIKQSDRNEDVKLCLTGGYVFTLFIHTCAVY